MGSYLSHLWWGGDPDTCDITSGLSRRDIHTIQKSWKPIYNNKAIYGTEIFIRLFSKYPETKDFFKKLKDKSEQELREDSVLRAHVVNFMTNFDMVVNYLDQPAIVVAMLTKLGESHAQRHIQEVHFNKTKEVLVAILKEDLHFDPATMQSWNKCIHFMYSYIFPQLSSNNKN